MDKAISRELRKRKNFIYCVTGTKVTKGIDTGKPAIVVGVLKKVSVEQLAKKDIIPAEIKGMLTDVVETTEVFALGVEQTVDRTSKIRPSACGVSIGHIDVTAGTQGLIVYRDGQPLILTCNHVGANVNKGKIGDPWLQPGPHDGGIISDKIATLEDFVKIKISELSLCQFSQAVVRVLNFIWSIFGRKTRFEAIAGFEANLVDCSLGKPINNSDVSAEILEIGKPVGEYEAFISMPMKFSGRTSDLLHSTVTGTDAAVTVNMGLGKYAYFEDLIMFSPPPKGGDSGSISLTDYPSTTEVIPDNMVVGLVFAGSETFGLANKYAHIKKALGLDSI